MQARVKARLADHHQTRAAAAAEAQQREQMASAVRQQLELQLGQAIKSKSLSTLLRKLGVLEMGVAVVPARELRNALKQAKVG